MKVRKSHKKSSKNIFYLLKKRLEGDKTE